MRSFSKSLLCLLAAISLLVALSSAHDNIEAVPEEEARIDQQRTNTEEEAPQLSGVEDALASESSARKHEPLTNAAAPAAFCSLRQANRDFIALPPLTFGGSFSIETLIRIDAATGFSARICDFGNGAASNNILMPLNGAQIIYEVYYGSVTTGFQAWYTVPIGRWLHVVWRATARPSTGKTFNELIIDGTVVFNSTFTNGVVPTLLRSRNYIGKSNWAADPYQSISLGWFHVWGRALTNQEIALASTGPITGLAPRPLLAYNFFTNAAGGCGINYLAGPPTPTPLPPNWACGATGTVQLGRNDTQPCSGPNTQQEPFTCVSRVYNVAKYTFTAPFRGSFIFSTFGTTCDTVLALRNATTCAERTCNDDSGVDLTSYGRVVLKSGERIVVAVGYYGGSQCCTVKLSITYDNGQCVPVASQYLSLNAVTPGGNTCNVPADPHYALCAGSYPVWHPQSFFFVAPTHARYRFTAVLTNGGTPIISVRNQLATSCKPIASVGCAHGTQTVWLQAGQQVHVVAGASGRACGPLTVAVRRL